MDYKKVALLLLFSAVVLAGCLDWLNPPAKDQYEIFSNLPTANAKGLAYMKFTSDGNKEVQDLFGKILAGNLMKKSQESEAGVVIYNDSFGMISYSKTNLTVSDAIDEMNSSMNEMTRQHTTFEKKNIGGKDVTIVHYSSTGYELPICVWKDGDYLKTLMTFAFPKTISPLGPTFTGNTENSGSLISYVLASASSVKTAAETCDVIMEQKYDTSDVKTMFNEVDNIKNTIPVSGKLFGEMKFYLGDNELANGSVYVVLFGDDNADQIVGAGRMDIANSSLLNSSQNYCKGSIVRSGSKQACMQEGGGTFSTINLQYITLMRKVGNYYIGSFTYIKDKKSTAEENAKNTLFSVSLPGTDASWTDKVNVEVKVYEQQGYSYSKSTPLADVRVDMFKSTSQYAIYSSPSNSELLKTEYTDNNGVAEFQNIPVNESLFFVASKEGYGNRTQSVYSFTSPVEVYMTKTEAPAVSTSAYTEPSYTTNVTIDEASLSNIPIINLEGIPVVKIVVGASGSGRDVKAAGNMAAMIGNRAYKKVSITATLSDPHCTPAQCMCIPSMQTADVPVKLDTSTLKLVLLDSEAQSMSMTLSDNLIAVGNDKVNTITSDVMKGTTITLGSPGDYIMQAVGSNRIIIAGYRKQDTAKAADYFMQLLTAAGAGGGALTFSNTQIISSDGVPKVRVVVGEQSTAGDSVEAANIAAMIGNLAYMHQQVTAAYSGGACIPSVNYSSQMAALKLVTTKLVIVDSDADRSATFIAIGPPSINTISNDVATATTYFTQNELVKGKAVVKGIGTNRIIIAGGTEMDTERAADRFIQWFANKYN